MRSEVGKPLRHQFRKRLNESLPGFVKSGQQKLPSGWYAFEYRLAETRQFYIVLVTHRLRDSFTIEAGWSCDGVLPETSSSNRAHLEDSEERQRWAAQERLCFRIGALSPSSESWWHLVPETTLEEMEKESERFERTGVLLPPPSAEPALANIDPMVESALEMIRQYVLPFFDQAARYCQILWMAA